MLLSKMTFVFGKLKIDDPEFMRSPLIDELYRKIEFPPERTPIAYPGP